MAKLLIVDDEIDVREFAGNFFSKRGIEVLLASDGQQALHLIQQEQPDLVLLDIRMNGMNGMDVLRRLRSNQNQTRVMMVSGIEDDQIVSEAQQLGVLGFIHKPLVLEELKTAVLNVLNEI